MTLQFIQIIPNDRHKIKMQASFQVGGTRNGQLCHCQIWLILAQCRGLGESVQPPAGPKSLRDKIFIPPVRHPGTQ